MAAGDTTLTRSARHCQMFPRWGYHFVFPPGENEDSYFCHLCHGGVFSGVCPNLWVSWCISVVLVCISLVTSSLSSFAYANFHLHSFSNEVLRCSPSIGLCVLAEELFVLFIGHSHVWAA